MRPRLMQRASYSNGCGEHHREPVCPNCVEQSGAVNTPPTGTSIPTGPCRVTGCAPAALLPPSAMSRKTSVSPRDGHTHPRRTTPQFLSICSRHRSHDLSSRGLWCSILREIPDDIRPGSRPERPQSVPSTDDTRAKRHVKLLH